MRPPSPPPPPTLRRLKPGPTVSLGRYLDYERFPDRDRFVQLDQLIAAGRGEEPSTTVPKATLAEIVREIMERRNERPRRRQRQPTRTSTAIKAQKRSAAA